MYAQGESVLSNIERKNIRHKWRDAYTLERVNTVERRVFTEYMSVNKYSLYKKMNIT